MILHTRRDSVENFFLAQFRPFAECSASSVHFFVVMPSVFIYSPLL